MAVQSYVVARKALLLHLIQDGTITNYRQACRVFDNVSWPTLRKVLKDLRDEGAIEADREYTQIAPIPAA